MARSLVTVALALMLALPAGCSDPFGSCTEETQVVEIVWGDPFEDVREAILDRLKKDGWKCHGESIRNAFGTQIGVKHTCTICK